MNNTHFFLEGGVFPTPNAMIKKGSVEEMTKSIKQAIEDESGDEVHSIKGLEDIIKYPSNLIHTIRVKQGGETYDYSLSAVWEY